MRMYTNCLFAALALMPAAAFAEEAGDAADTIVVTATRTETLLSETGKAISLLDAKTIEQRQTLSVADLLRTLPGVTIASNGGPGAFTSIFIRGASSEQTVALIDGVKINDPASPGGGFNFADLLTDNLDRIELLRGPQSVLWGSRAIGGVVNMITRAPTDELSVRASGEYGRYDTGHLTGAVTGKAGPVGFSAGAGYLTTDGFSVADGGSEDDGYHLFGANLKTETKISDAVSLDLRGYYTKAKVDLDGFPPPTYSLADTNQYQRQEQIVGYAGLNVLLFDGRLKNRFAAAYTRVDRTTYDDTLTPPEDFDSRGTNRRFEYQGIADLGLVQATFGAEHEQERFRTVSVFSPLAREKADIDSLYLDLHAKPVTGLSLGAGVRYDDHSQFGDATTMSADAAYSPNDGATTLRASYSEGFKAPTLYQLYDGFYGTPGLRPERAKGFDGGIEQKLFDGKLELRATLFQRRVTNQIDFDLGTFTYANIARARARGVELEMRAAPTEALLLTANYTFTNARNRQRTDANFGNQLARRPRHSANATIDYDWGFGLRTGATVIYAGKSYDDAGNFTRLDDYVLVDLRAAYPVTDQVELTARITNLFDEKYQTASGYGQAGRAAFAGVRLRY